MLIKRRDDVLGYFENCKLDMSIEEEESFIHLLCIIFVPLRLI